MKRIIASLSCIYLSCSVLTANEISDDPINTDSIPTETVNLEEIVVKAPLIRREADRVVVNVSANPLSANKNAQELLKTAPGVWATDETLSIYGQDGTTVYIDDRKINMSGAQLMTYLKSIQSSSISTIEIIPKAGAEYSADSSGGIIRINLKRNRIDGVNGSTGINVTAGKYKQWFNPFLNLGLHSGKWTFNFNGNLNGNLSDRYNIHRESTNTALSQTMTGMSRHDEKTIQGNALLGIFYDPTEVDKLGLQFDYNSNRSRQKSNSQTTTYGLDFYGNTFGKYIIDDCFHNFNTTFNWSHSMDENGSVFKLIANYNYQSSSVNEDNEMSWSHLPNDSVYNTDNDNKYNIFVAEISLRKVFSQKWILNIGAKYTLNHVSNKSFHHYLDGKDWIADKDYDYNTSYNENIAAFYATANGNAGRWKFKAGVRGEYSQTSGSLTNTGGFDLFPNVNVAYNLTENGLYTVALGYHRNIHRPSFWSLDPVVKQNADYSYTVGNPYLTPSFTDGISLDFVLAGKFTVATGYSMTDKPIRQTFISNPEYPERMYLTWGNQGKDRSVLIHGDGFINITKWWNLYTSLTWVLTSQKLSAKVPFDTFNYVRLVASTTFVLPKDFTLNLNCFYNSKMKIGNITVYPIFNLNPTLQKRFGKHWSLSIGVENMLQRKNKIRTVSAEYTRLIRSKNYATAKIGITYNFNSGKSFRSPRIETNTDPSRFCKD